MATRVKLLLRCLVTIEQELRLIRITVGIARAGGQVSNPQLCRGFCLVSERVVGFGLGLGRPGGDEVLKAAQASRRRRNRLGKGDRKSVV